MPNYRRIFRPGGTYFFTLVAENRAPILTTDTARPLLRSAIAECRTNHLFDLVAIVLLPDHLHMIWILPDNDADYPRRLSFIKSAFTRAFLATGGPEQPRSTSRIHHGNRGIWQRRYWEHTIRDDHDFENHRHYLHYNPVKHGLATCPHAWPHTSFPNGRQKRLPPNLAMHMQ